MAALPLNPHFTLQQKIDQLEREIERISAKFPEEGDQSNVTTDEIFALCAHKLMLKDLYHLKSQGKTEWCPSLLSLIHI